MLFKEFLDPQNKFLFYLKKKKTTIKHNTHTHTHTNSQLLRWYAMILIYSKSGILLQLHFLWFLNSNLQINKLGAANKLPICQSLFKRKDINNHTLYKDQICPRVKSFDTFYSSSSSPKQEVIS